VLIRNFLSADLDSLIQPHEMRRCIQSRLRHHRREQLRDRSLAVGPRDQDRPKRALRIPERAGKGLHVSQVIPDGPVLVSERVKVSEIVRCYDTFSASTETLYLHASSLQ